MNVLWPWTKPILPTNWGPHKSRGRRYKKHCLVATKTGLSTVGGRLNLWASLPARIDIPDHINNGNSLPKSFARNKRAFICETAICSDYLFASSPFTAIYVCIRSIRVLMLRSVHKLNYSFVHEYRSMWRFYNTSRSYWKGKKPYLRFVWLYISS